MLYYCIFFTVFFMLLVGLVGDLGSRSNSCYVCQSKPQVSYNCVRMYTVSALRKMPLPDQMLFGMRLQKFLYLNLLHIMSGYQYDKAVTKNDTREVI